MLLSSFISLKMLFRHVSFLTTMFSFKSSSFQYCANESCKLICSIKATGRSLKDSNLKLCSLWGLDSRLLLNESKVQDLVDSLLILELYSLSRSYAHFWLKEVTAEWPLSLTTVRWVLTSFSERGVRFYLETEALQMEPAGRWRRIDFNDKIYKRLLN